MFWGIAQGTQNADFYLKKKCIEPLLGYIWDCGRTYVHTHNEHFRNVVSILP
jgi:hypothetical protein